MAQRFALAREVVLPVLVGDPAHEVPAEGCGRLLEHDAPVALGLAGVEEGADAGQQPAPRIGLRGLGGTHRRTQLRPDLLELCPEEVPLAAEVLVVGLSR